MPSATAILSLNVSAIRELTQGSVILNGATAPSTNLGRNGDFYINTVSYFIYGPKNSATFWQSSASLVGPSGTSGSSFSLSALSSFLFDPDTGTAGYFTASAMRIENSDRIGLIIDSTGFTCIDVDTTASTVATFKQNGVTLLSINSAAVTLSSNLVSVASPFTMNKSVTAYVDAGERFLINNFIDCSGSKTVIGPPNIIPGGFTDIWDTMIVADKVVNLSDVWAVTNDVGVANLVCSVNKIGINVPYSHIQSVSAFTSTLTVSGTISASHISLSSINIPAISGAGAPTASNVPQNHFIMWYDTTSTTLCAAYNIAGVIKAVPFLTV